MVLRRYTLVLGGHAPVLRRHRLQGHVARRLRLRKQAQFHPRRRLGIRRRILPLDGGPVRTPAASERRRQPPDIVPRTAFSAVIHAQPRGQRGNDRAGEYQQKGASDEPVGIHGLCFPNRARRSRPVTAEQRRSVFLRSIGSIRLTLGDPRPIQRLVVAIAYCHLVAGHPLIGFKVRLPMAIRVPSRATWHAENNNLTTLTCPHIRGRQVYATDDRTSSQTDLSTIEIEVRAVWRMWEIDARYIELEADGAEV
mmetsp:Transcript_102052/g.288178  ORF Transcript_102052/g.288178 Transcript_102052/m.288178 type:complete len:253 (+) Transcript_102052:304-1062(+)